jgi:hypothetical protein
MDRNAYCGLCGECFRTCPKDNVEVSLRVPGDDLVAAREWRLDEAYKAFILLACAAIYPAVFLGPWGWLKAWADLESWSGFALYAAAFLGITLGLVPAVHLGLAAAVRRVGRRDALRLAGVFTGLAYPLVPLGLAAWAAFTLAFVSANISYALPVLSDPFGWGWNLFGTRHVAWVPLLTTWVPVLQALIVILGLIFAIRTADSVLRAMGPARRQWQSLALTATVLTAEALVFLWLHLGILA